jgi:Protein tyrosine and serine/threonine kinase
LTPKSMSVCLPIHLSVCLSGAGAQGVVHAGWWEQGLGHRRPVAVKKFHSTRAAVLELEMHLLVGRNKHVVELLACCYHRNTIFMVLEYFPRWGFRV